MFGFFPRCPVVAHACRFAPAALLAGAVTLGGCASAPVEELEQAGATVSLASRSDDASPELARANVKLALARRWVAASDYGPARWLVEQAQVDAELALAKAAAANAQRAASLLRPPNAASWRAAAHTF